MSSSASANAIEFNGEKFPTLAHFRRAYPAFSSDEVIRAIRSGCRTVMEVETYSWHRRRGTLRKMREAAQSSPFAAKYSMLGKA